MEASLDDADTLEVKYWYRSDTESFSSSVTSRSNKILRNLSCKTNKCVYHISYDV